MWNESEFKSKTVFAIFRTVPCMESEEEDVDTSKYVEVSRIFAVHKDAEEFLAERMENEELEETLRNQRFHDESRSGKPFREDWFPQTPISKHLPGIQTCLIWFRDINDL